MKRSEINAIMRDVEDLLSSHQFLLPPFAHWTPDDWRGKGLECRAIVEQQLGWDITDFGSGDFARCGLFLFTLRNGTLADLEVEGGKIYAEKIMVVREQQVTPTHFHFQKMEDIINRGGGKLVIQVWNASDDEGLADTPVRLARDGVQVQVPAGDQIVLEPGDSVTLPQRNYHQFWGQEGAGTVVVGEVSRVNDDRVDNRFLEPVGRFPDIEEDEPALHLLSSDYPQYYKHCPA